MNRDILHPITEAQITEYEENGAICIRGQFDAEWCQHMLEVSENNMKNRAGRQREVDNDDDPGYFYVSSYMSRQNKDFEDYILNSPSAEIAARLMRLDLTSWNAIFPMSHSYILLLEYNAPELISFVRVKSLPRFEYFFLFRLK